MLSSIRVRVMLLFALGLTVFLSLVMGYVLVEVRNQYTDLLLQKGEVAAADLHERAEKLFGLGLLLDEFLGFEQQCRQIVDANPGVAHAGLSDANGVLLYQASRGPVGRLASIEDLPPRRLNMLIRSPLDAAQARGGQIMVVLDESLVDHQVNRLLLRILVVGGLVALFGSLLLYVFLRQTLGTPAARLLRHIKDIDPKDLKGLPDELQLRRDEIGTIAQAFDFLIASLAKSQRALLRANDELVEHARTLEQRVKDRTAKLKQANLELNRLAHTDALTGLPNRLAFMATLEKRFRHAKRHGHPFAIFVLDLDGFKSINDRFGHAAGDHTLQQVALRFRESIRGGDDIFRLGGDEFALLMEDFKSEDDLHAMAAKLDRLISAPQQWRDKLLRVGASIGIAVLGDEVEADSLLAAADSAMYQAKRSAAHATMAAKPELDSRVS